MQFHGFSKLTLLDYPGHLACTAFTGGCNFRCPFCHNASLVLTPDSFPSIGEQDILDFLISRKGKLEGICITGGEPTLQKDLKKFCKKIKDLGFLVKLDTNGYQPEILEHLIKENFIDAVAMDIKNDKAHYAMTCGLQEESFDLSRIEKSISLLMQSSLPYEFRTTIMKELHSKDNIRSIGLWLAELYRKNTRKNLADFPYFLQTFKDSGNLVDKSSAFHPHSLETMQKFEALLQAYIPNTKLRG